MKKTVSRFISRFSYGCPSYQPFEPGYHISCNKNGKNRFPFKVEEDLEQEVYFVVCRNYQELNAVMRREFGWK